MSIELIAFLAVAILLLLILVEVPVGIAMMAAGASGLLMSNGVVPMSSALESSPYRAAARYALIVIPMFVLLGSVVSNAGVGEKIFIAANKLIGWAPGGLPASTVFATAVFSGISGSSAADVAAFGRVATTQMNAHGYRKEYGAAVVAAAGTFAVLIPPSVGVIIYALLAEVSIGAMLLAAVVPGIISCLAAALFVVFQNRKRQVGAVAGPSMAPDLPGRGWTPRSGVFSGFTGLGYAAVLFTVVIGGLYSGLFTATEAGAVGAFAATLLGLIALRGRSGGAIRLLGTSVREAAVLTSTIFLLFVGGAVFNYFIVTAGIAADLARWAGQLEIATPILMVVCLLLLLLMGTLIDGLTIMLLTVPLLAPIMEGLGVSLVWFGVLVIKAIEIGLITPPVGLNIYVVASIVPDVKPERIFAAVAPFVVLDVVITALFFLVPDVVLWLPRQAGVM